MHAALMEAGQKAWGWLSKPCSPYQFDYLSQFPCLVIHTPSPELRGIGLPRCLGDSCRSERVVPVRNAQVRALGEQLGRTEVRSSLLTS